MHRGRIGCRRWALSLAVGSVVACATMAATAASALAGGVSVKHSYTVNISPASVPAGKSTTLDVALANTSSPGGSLSSAELLPPLGFRVVHASLPSGATGHVHVILNIVVLDHLSVAPGSTLHLSVTVAAPPKCHTFFNRWLSDANTGGLFSQDLRLDLAHSSLTTDVTCVTATGLKFDTQPNDTVVSDEITGNQYDTGGPPVTVDIVDAGGNLVDSSAPVTIALGNNPADATLGGTLTQNAVHGVATFNDLTLDKPDNGYTLTASSSGLASDKSTSFDENNNADLCPADGCTSTLSTANTSISLLVGAGTGDTFVTESVDVGTPQNDNEGCARYEPRSPDWYEFIVGDSDRSKNVTWDVNDASSDGFQVCYGAPYEFQVLDPTTGELGPAPEGTLPDGTSGFVGLLASCEDIDGGNSPCIESISSPDEGGTRAIVDIPAGNDGDPWMGR